jgi:hypothetical protein
MSLAARAGHLHDAWKPDDVLAKGQVRHTLAGLAALLMRGNSSFMEKEMRAPAQGAGAPSLPRQHGRGETGILSSRAPGRDQLSSLCCKRMFEQAARVHFVLADIIVVLVGLTR